VGKKILGLMLALPLVGALPAAADDWRRDGRYDDGRYDDGYYRDRNSRDDRYYEDGYYRNGRYYGRGGAFDEGYMRGFDEGAKEGSKDGRRGTRFELWSEGRYRDGDHGYKSTYGPRTTYVSGFRRGYEEGYRRGYGSRASGPYYRTDDRVIREYPRY
jgi:hypothetical protein